MVLVVVALGSVGALFRRVDWNEAAHCLLQLKTAAPLVLVPYLLQLALDALAWRYTFESSARVSLRSLFAIRLATDALANSLPGGVALAEATRAVLVRQRFALPIAEAAGNLMISKLTTVLGQGLFVVMGIALAGPTLRANSQRLIGRAGLQDMTLGVSIAFLIASAGVLAVVAKGRLLGQTLSALRRAGGHEAGMWLGKLEQPCRDLDRGLGAADRVGRAQLARSVAASFCAWFTMGLETWVIFLLLSPGVSLTQALSIEAMLSVVRVLFFFLPAGLGAQEASYFALIAIHGVPHADVVAVAFVIAKRMKELVWVGAGYLTLWALNARAPVTIEARAS